MDNLELRQYEINLLSKTDDKISLKIEELLIGIEDDCIHFYSPRHKKYIRPILSNAFNYNLSKFPIFKFLCDTQINEEIKSLELNWGDYYKNKAFLPRLKYKNIIVKKAIWNLPFKKNSLSSFEKFLSSFSDYKKKYDIPAYVSYTEFDQKMLIITEDRFSLEILYELVRKYKLCILEEVPEIDEESITKTPTGDKKNEFVFFFQNSHLKLKPTHPLPFYDDSLWEHNWVYYNLECQPTSAIPILRHLKNITQPLVNEGKLEKWFYTKIIGQSFELRFRYLANDSYFHEVFVLIHNAVKQLQQQHTVSTFTIKPYIRELNRYREKIRELETVFFIDSITSLDLAQICSQKKDGEETLTLLAIISLYDYAQLLFKDEEKTQQFIRSTKEYYHIEFGSSVNLKKTINKKFRDWKNKILDKAYINPQALNILKFRKQKLSKYFNENFIQEQLEYYAFDIIHMHFIRLFTTKPRLQEFIIYDLLYSKLNLTKWTNKSI